MLDEEGYSTIVILQQFCVCWERSQWQMLGSPFFLVEYILHYAATFSNILVEVLSCFRLLCSLAITTVCYLS